MVQVTLEEVSNNLLSYLQRVQAGESFVVVAAGQPIAEIKPAQNLPLAGALSQLHQICKAENYALELEPRLDCPNQLLNDLT